jgi:hypothetical protein
LAAGPVSKLGIEWDRWEKYCLTSNRQLKLNISDMDLSILKVSRKYINKSILEF